MAVRLDSNSVKSTEELVELYIRRAAVSGINSETLFYTSFEKHQDKLRQIADVLTSTSNGDELSILDVGCGYGALLSHLPTHLKYTGIDPVEVFVDRAKKDYPEKEFLVGKVEDFPNARADLCIIAGVLSSVPDSLELLSVCCKRTNRRMVFDITIRERLPQDYEDLNCWTIEEVEAILGLNGFSMVKVHDNGYRWVVVSAERA